MNVGFVGLGTMGAPMADRLLDAGHTVSGCNKTSPVRPELVDKGMRPLSSPKDVAEAAEVVILMVPDTPDVAEALFGERGVSQGLKKGTTVVDMSSISPVETKQFANEIQKLGCAYVDAPVSGGEVGARAGTLTIMAGGADEDFKRVEPLFRQMGQNITLVGEVGAGQTCKVANQIIVALNIEAVAEALLFARKAGADPAKVRNALMGGFASSKVLEIHGERMIKRTFEPGFRIELHQKDLNLALSSARELELGLPNTANAQELFNACAALGARYLDHSAMVRALEALADQVVA